MSLDARVVVRRGDFTLDVHLHVDEGEVVAVLGPNGSGKTTLLHSLCGLLPLDEGRIEVDGAVFDDVTADVFVPPAERPVGVVFQGNLLFEHLSVRDNVVFGLRARGVRQQRAGEDVAHIVERLQLGALLDRRPSELSGGQAQRVAIARALATGPRMLLLDEPMSALDAATRQQLRLEFRGLLGGFAGYRLVVTHDPDDALALADQVVVLDRGTVAWRGPVAEYRRG